ncbi:MAG: hypothetical protein AAFV87_06270 [Pseudomonadota bacterium]
MFRRLSSDTWLGLLACFLALLLIFVWIPLDTETGLIERVRRQVTLGDSLGPTVAAGILLLGGLLTVLRPDAGGRRLHVQNWRWIAMIIAVVGGALVLMRFVGPWLVELFGTTPYRDLRATPPWSYAGFMLGGTYAIATLVALARGRLTVSAVILGLVTSVAIALFYDLPFDDLQLPPNGDV